MFFVLEIYQGNKIQENSNYHENDFHILDKF